MGRYTEISSGGMRNKLGRDGWTVGTVERCLACEAVVNRETGTKCSCPCRALSRLRSALGLRAGLQDSTIEIGGTNSEATERRKRNGLSDVSPRSPRPRKRGSAPQLPWDLPQHLGVSREFLQERKQAFNGFDRPVAGQTSPDGINLLQVVSWDQ
jgi:hypothetical protein